MKFFLLCVSLLGIFDICFAEVVELVAGGKNIIQDEKRLHELSQSIREHLRKLSGQAQGGNLELIQLHSATSQLVTGVLYDAFAELRENSVIVNCSISLWEKPWEKFIKLDVECGKEKRKYAYATQPVDSKNHQALGGFQEISNDGLKELFPKLTATFDQLSREHSDFNVSLKRIVNGKYQVVAGSHYVLHVDVAREANVHQCEVDILENLQSEFDRVDVACGHHKKVFHYVRLHKD